MSLVMLTFALAMAVGTSVLSAALSMAPSSHSPWTSKSGSSQTTSASLARTEVRTLPKLSDVTGDSILYSTQTATNVLSKNTDSGTFRNTLLGNTLSKAFVSASALMSDSTSSRKVFSPVTVFPHATGAVSVSSKSTTHTTKIVSDVSGGSLFRILMLISGPETSTESDTTPTPTSTPTTIPTLTSGSTEIGNTKSSSSASLSIASDSTTFSGITYRSTPAPSRFMSASPVTTFANVLSESATTPAAVTSDCSTTPVGVTCHSTGMATTVVSASVMSGSPQTTPVSIVNNNSTVPAILVAGNTTTRSSSVVSDSPTTPASAASDWPTVGAMGSSVSSIFSGSTLVSETMEPSSSRFSSVSLPLSRLFQNTMTVSQHTSSESTLPGVTGSPPNTMSASVSDSTAASGITFPGSSTNSGYILSDSTITFGNSASVPGNSLSDSPTMSGTLGSGTLGSGTIPVSGSSLNTLASETAPPGVSTDSAITLSSNAVTTVATTDKLTTSQTTKLTSSTTSTTRTTTLDPVRCNGKLPPVSVDASLAVIAPQVIAYRCNDGFKETGRGTAIIECKKTQGWVDEEGNGNPTGLECELLSQEPEVPPWLYPALIALLAMLVLLVICFLVVYILRSRGVCARRKRPPEADPHLRRKPNPSSALSLPPGHAHTTISGTKWSGTSSEKTSRSFWSSQIKSHDSRVYPAPLTDLRHGDGVPWVEA